MIFSLVQDFAAALEVMPEGHPRCRILALLDEAIRRDVHFIDRHPTTLFQCLWNSCWWYDHTPTPLPEADNAAAAPGRTSELAQCLEGLRRAKESRTPGHIWIRSLRQPTHP